jgi:hypothetical protein
VVYGKSVGVVLLENPVGSGVIGKSQLAEEISTVFGLDPTRKRPIFIDSSFKNQVSDNLASLDGQVPTVLVKVYLHSPMHVTECMP